MHKLIVGSRRREDHDGTAKTEKDRLQSKTLMEAMIVLRRHTELAEAYVEAWRLRPAWREAIDLSHSLAATPGHGVAAVEAACAEALQAGIARGYVVLAILARQRQPPPAPSIPRPTRSSSRPSRSPIASATRSLGGTRIHLT